MAKHCTLYLKILLTFLVPSIFLSFDLLKGQVGKKRSEWWHQRGLLPSTQTNLRAEEHMVTLPISNEGWNSQTRGQSLLCIRAARCVPSSQAPLRESNFLLRSGE